MKHKPQLLIQDLETLGRHSGNRKRTQQRLSQSAAWKRQRIITLVPAAALISSKVYLSHRNIIYPPNNGVVHMLAYETEVGNGYSLAIEQILAHPELSTWEYLLTIEADNMPPSDGVVRLVERLEANPRLSAVGGLYYTKGEGGVPQIWGDPKDPVLNFRPQLPDPGGGMVECCGTGMGFNLWRLKMFKDKRLRRPWFVTQKDKEGVATQDLYFWADARKHGHRCAIDCSVRVGHYDIEKDIVW